MARTTYATAHMEAGLHEKISNEAKKNERSYSAQVLEYIHKAEQFDEQNRKENVRKEELKQRKAARQMKGKEEL